MPKFISRSLTLKPVPMLTLAALAGAAALSLAGCNTVSGAGKDLQESSDATKKAITGEGKSSGK